MSSMEEEWERPTSVPFPTIWNRFDGTIPIDGKIQKFFVVDVTENLNDFIIELLTQALLGDPTTITQTRDFWRKVLKQKLSLACIVYDEYEVGIELAAVCLNWRFSKHDHPPGEPILRTIWPLRNYVTERHDFLDKFDVSELMYGVGTYVFPKYANEIVGVETLKCKELVCRESGIRLIMGQFTSEKSQEVAKAAGYTDYALMTFDECATSVNNNQPDFKLMYIYI